MTQETESLVAFGGVADGCRVDVPKGAREVWLDLTLLDNKLSGHYVRNQIMVGERATEFLIHSSMNPVVAIRAAIDGYPVARFRGSVKTEAPE